MRRKVFVLESYYDEIGQQHYRRVPGVRFGGSHFGRVRVLCRSINAGGCVIRKIRPASLRSRDA